MLHDLIANHPNLVCCETAIQQTAAAMITCYGQGGKLLLCGNGGSSADCEHVVGELMKGFLKKRPLTQEARSAMKQNSPALDETVLTKLQAGLPALSLPSMMALNSAFANDVDPELIYAQSVLALGRPGDVFVGISTSGNAKNVLAAATVAKGLGLTVVALTGKTGGALKTVADICIAVPETETFKVQELHLPVYHYLCAATEAHFFTE